MTSTSTSTASTASTWARAGGPVPAVTGVEDGPRTVWVPQAGGAVIGIVHAAPWLATGVAHAQARTGGGLRHWPGQPVFTDEDAAREWVGWFRALAPELGVDGWTVQPVLVTLDPAGDPAADLAAGPALRRVRPVTADGHRAFWQRPASLLAESARAYLAALAAHLHGHVLPHLELAHAALTGHALDEATLRQLAGVQQLLASAAAALVDLAAGCAPVPGTRPAAARIHGSSR